MTDNNQIKIPDLEPESGLLLISATPGGFQAFAKTNVEHIGNSHVLLLIRGIMEVLQSNPITLYEAGQEALKQELSEQGIDLNDLQEINEEAVQARGDYDYSNVVSLANIKPKGNA